MNDPARKPVDPNTLPAAFRPKSSDLPAPVVGPPARFEPPPHPQRPPVQPARETDPRSFRLDLVFGALCGLAALVVLPFVGLLLYSLGDDPFDVGTLRTAAALGALSGVPGLCAIWLGLHRLVDDRESDHWTGRPPWAPALMGMIFLAIFGVLSFDVAGALAISTLSLAWLTSSMRGSMRVAASETEGDPADFQITIGQIAAATFAAAATFGVVRTSAAMPGPIDDFGAVLLIAAAWVLADFLAAWLIVAVDVHIVGWAAAVTSASIGGFILWAAENGRLPVERMPLDAALGLLVGHVFVVCLVLQAARSSQIRLVKVHVTTTTSDPFSDHISSSKEK